MSETGLRFEASGAAPDRLRAYADLLGEVFRPAPKFTPEALAWRYGDNPAGQVVGTDAWDERRLAAHYVTCPVAAEVEGRALKGLLSLNTATHPEFQGAGLFTQLAEATYARATGEGFDFVIGVANENSTPGFIRRLGFQLVAPLVAGVLLRGPGRFGAAEVQYRANWTPETLAWRLANPAGRYRVARTGALTGVWARTHLPGVHCAAFLAEEAPANAAPPLAASLFIGLEPRATLPMIPLPRRLRPSPLNLIWRPLGSAAPRTLDPAAVALSFLDFDPY